MFGTNSVHDIGESNGYCENGIDKLQNGEAEKEMKKSTLLQKQLKMKNAKLPFTVPQMIDNEQAGSYILIQVTLTL